MRTSKRWIVCAILWALCSVLATALVSAESQAYQAIEGRNAQGLIVVANPRWEYNQAGGTYRLVKQKTAAGKTVYYKLSDGALQLGSQAGCYYAFDAKGDMLTGVYVIHGKRYYFTPKCQAVKTKQTAAPEKTTWGMAVKSAWKKVGKSWYYFNSIGQQAPSKKGLQKIHGAYYYLDREFVPCTEKWVKQRNGAWWYFNKNGKYNSRRIHSQKIGGAYYYLKKNGQPYRKCFKKAGGRKYYYTSSGKRANYTGWKTLNNKKYYFSRAHYVIQKTGWQRIGGKYFYFGKKGGMYARKWLTKEGKLYYFRANGQMAVGWLKIGDAYYHFTKAGALDKIESGMPQDVIIEQDIPQDNTISAEKRKAAAQAYVGRTMEELIKAIGKPQSETGRMPSCQGDGTGEDAAYAYDGFTVMTYEKDGIRTVTGVE